MPSVIVTNMRYTNLLQGALSAPRPSSREEFPMSAQTTTFHRRPTGIHSLPVELLTNIFVLGAAFDYPYANSPFLLKPEQAYDPAPPSNFQVVVSHVCQQWRQVALRTPSLWTTLHFREFSHISRAITYLTRCTRSTTYLLDILIDSVAEEDHTPGVTLYKDEVRTIFQMIVPQVQRWRAFHLKICDNHCKLLARTSLSTCGPAPNLETLQLYHFEDYRTTQNLYIATYRPPVVVFDNTLPRLKNVSLIGVNLPWQDSPYLMNLSTLELALHPNNIRPPHVWWARMLKLSPNLETLCLHYSGPRDGAGDPTFAWPLEEEKIQLIHLRELSLTDLDPDYLCGLFSPLNLPNIKTLTLDLPDQDFTPFLELMTKNYLKVEDNPHHGPDPSTEVPISSLDKLRTLTLRALDCSWTSWVNFILDMQNLRRLEVDFTRMGTRFWKLFTEECSDRLSSQPTSSPILPHLQVLKVSGISGKDLLAALRYRSSKGYICLSARWIIGWTERRRGWDLELDALVDQGWWTSGEKDVRVDIETFEDDSEDDDEGEDVENEDPEGSEEGETTTTTDSQS